MDKEAITIKSENYEFPAYYLKSQDKSRANAVILIHEIWGLNDNIRGIAQRLQREGYAVLAPDLLGDSGVLEKISPQIFKEMADPNTKNEAQKKMRAALTPLASPEFAKKTMEKLHACYAFLNDIEKKENIAAIGFCFGGTYSFAMAVNESGLKAAVVFYGQCPQPLSEIEKINCPVLAFYGENDTSLVFELPKLLEKMEEYDKDFAHKVYKNTGHAFFNEHNEQMYNKESADDAWIILKDFLKEKMN